MVVTLPSCSWRCCDFELATLLLSPLGKAPVTLLITFTSNLSTCIFYKSRLSGLLIDRPDNVSMTFKSSMKELLSSHSSVSDSSVILFTNFILRQDICLFLQVLDESKAVFIRKFYSFAIVRMNNICSFYPDGQCITVNRDISHMTVR